MTRKRASLVGRGVEILFGEGQGEAERANASNSEPLPAESPSSPADVKEASAEEPMGGAEEAMEAEWAAMLEEEATTAMAGAEPVEEAEAAVTEEAAVPVGVPSVSAEYTAENGRPDWPAVHAEEEAALPALATEPAQPAGEGPPLLTTEPARPAGVLPPLATEPAQPAGVPPMAEVPLYSEPASAMPAPVAAPAAYTLPAAASEPVTPPAPAYAELAAPSERPAASVPPPREKTGAFGELVLTEVRGPLLDTAKPSEEDLEPEGPRADEVELRELVGYEEGQPSRLRDEDEILRFVGPKRRQSLWQEIDTLYEEVPVILCADPKQPDALQLLQEAQDILMESPRQFDVARYKVSQVQSIVTTRKNITRWTNTYGWGTFAYLVLWLIVLGAAVLFAPLVVSWIESTVGDTPRFIDLAQLWNTAVWGSVGGVLGAFYSLYWHAAQVKDFHKQYLMWYIVQPVIGIVIGGFVYLIIGAGFISALGQTTSGQQTILSLFPYAVACIASFRQRFILEIIDRMIQFLTGAKREEEE